ncbi:hypothetical protein FA95DRAFT_1564181 [Auriscalpium vulgare]|uniref:Uncharacterized protein n=1 Tax=Auriscalpium vulgare TaxID=40419 RepID=A0ACB8RFD7_9AGAM|nr:hypothetical protein FA95DRAFT_1564181 [Auriscalpium vulgare]
MSGRSSVVTTNALAQELVDSNPLPDASSEPATASSAAAAAAAASSAAPTAPAAPAAPTSDSWQAWCTRLTILVITLALAFTMAATMAARVTDWPWGRSLYAIFALSWLLLFAISGCARKMWSRRGAPRVVQVDVLVAQLVMSLCAVLLATMDLQMTTIAWIFLSVVAVVLAADMTALVSFRRDDTGLIEYIAMGVSKRWWDAPTASPEAQRLLPPRDEEACLPPPHLFVVLYMLTWSRTLCTSRPLTSVDQ